MRNLRNRLASCQHEPFQPFIDLLKPGDSLVQELPTRRSITIFCQEEVRSDAATVHIPRNGPNKDPPDLLGKALNEFVLDYERDIVYYTLDLQ